MQNETFSDADLAYELSEITRAANRANTTIYTIDPRGLVAGQDIDEPVDPQEWGEHLRKTQDTMRVLADDTGGISVVNQNDFDKALKRIDADSSDYYILGYYSSNPDPDAPPAEDRGQGAAQRDGRVHAHRIPGAQTSAAAGVELAEVARRFAFRIRAAPRSGSARTVLTVFRSLSRFLQVGLVDVRPDEIDAESRARDRRAAEARERIHRGLNPRQAVQPQTLFGKARRERRRVRPIAVAPLDRLVRNEPRVAAAANAVRRCAPPADVRLVLIGHAEREAVDRRRALAA